MYIARHRIKGRTHYHLRQSYAAGGGYRSRELVDLGQDPRVYVVYPDDGCAFYIHEDLCDRLSELGVEPDNDELERVFYPFLDPETQRVIEGFSHPGMSRKDQSRLREAVDRAEKAHFHIFDKRRMHYLRFVEMDQSRIHKAPKKIYRDLLDKSRDEIEQYFMEKEEVLAPREKKVYPYVIFDVAGHFPGMLARRFPQALSQEEVDACFIEELCRLNADEAFWADAARPDGLNEYLVRYVCWFFDSEFGETRYMEELIREWMARRNTMRPPAAKDRMRQEDALAVMGISEDAFAGMNIRRLTRQYRYMAQTRHPDKGGGHEGFIRLNRAFETLLSRLKAGGSPGRYRPRRG
jgi:hypothetical protein